VPIQLKKVIGIFENRSDHGRTGSFSQNLGALGATRSVPSAPIQQTRSGPAVYDGNSAGAEPNRRQLREKTGIGLRFATATRPGGRHAASLQIGHNNMGSRARTKSAPSTACNGGSAKKEMLNITVNTRMRRALQEQKGNRHTPNQFVKRPGDHQETQQQGLAGTGPRSGPKRNKA